MYSFTVKDEKKIDFARIGREQKEDGYDVSLVTINDKPVALVLSVEFCKQFESCEHISIQSCLLYGKCGLYPEDCRVTKTLRASPMANSELSRQNFHRVIPIHNGNWHNELKAARQHLKQRKYTVNVHVV